MALKAENAIWVGMKNKWGINCTFYIFLCLDCGREVLLRKYQLKKATGRCASCTAIFNGREMISRNGIEPFRALYNKMAGQAKIRDKSFDLTFEEFLEFTKIDICHYCDAPIVWRPHAVNKNKGGYHLDRKNNNEGYNKNNLVVCCWNCNQRKKHLFTYEQFITIGNLISKWEGR